ncbi:MAG: PAS domain S-box protein [Chloroflexota bacterium]
MRTAEVTVAPTDTELYTPKQAAEILSVSLTTLRRWIRSGKLPAVQSGSRGVRIKRAQLDALRCAPGRSEMLSHRLITELTAHAPGVLYVFDLVERRNVFVNRQTGSLLGYSDDEILALGEEFLSKVLHPDDAPRLEQHFARLEHLSEQATAEVEYRFRHRDGSWRWFHSIDRVYRQEVEGRPRQILGISTDITERRQMEEVIRSSEEHYRLLVEQALDGIFVTDPQGRFLDVNPAGCQMLGYTRDELLNLGMADVIVDRDASRIATEARRYAGAQTVRSQWQYRRKDGREFIGEVVGRQLTDGQFQAVVRDITVRHASELALQESEARFRALFSSIDEGYCLGEMILDVDGRAVDYRFLEVNPLFESMTGLANAVGRTAYELLPDLEPHWVATYARVALDGEVLRFENGSEVMGRWFDVFATPVEPRGRFALVFKDVTERKRAEREREELLAREHAARAEAEAAVRQRDEFLSIAAHELKTPIAVMRGRAQLNLRRLRRDPDADTESMLAAFSSIEAQSRKLERLVAQLLDIARFESGRLSLETAPLDLVPWLNETVAAARDRARDRDFSVDAPAAAVLEVDGLRLEQVLNNLLDNAIKYSPVGTPIHIALVTEQSAENGLITNGAGIGSSMVSLAVSDQGPGIPAEHRERVFERFHQVRPGDTIRGFGLGLFVSREIVELHGGSLTVEDADGGGARFLMRLPFRVTTGVLR